MWKNSLPVFCYLLVPLLTSCGETTPASTSNSQDPPGDLKAFDLVKTYEQVRAFAGPEAELVEMHIDAYVNSDGTLDLTKNRFNEEFLHIDRSDIGIKYVFVRPFIEITSIDSTQLTSDTSGRIGEQTLTRTVYAKPPFPYQEVDVIIQHQLYRLPRIYRGRRAFSCKDMLEYDPRGVDKKRTIPPLTDFVEMLQRALKEAGMPDSASVHVVYYLRDSHPYISFTISTDGPFEEGYYGQRLRWVDIVNVTFDKDHKVKSVKKEGK